MRVKISTALILVVLAASAATAQVPEQTPNTVTISLIPAPNGGNFLLLRIEAYEVTDLYGFSFDLEFPKKKLRWRKNNNAAGSFLSDNDTAETFIINKQKPRGTLHVGTSRLGDLPGVTGSGILLDIGFINKTKKGPRDLVLSNALAFDSAAQPLADLVWEVLPFTDSGS